MTPGEERHALLAELETVQAQIDAAYGVFTRQARAHPPGRVCPEAYARRKAIRERLIALASGQGDRDAPPL